MATSQCNPGYVYGKCVNNLFKNPALIDKILKDMEKAELIYVWNYIHITLFSGHCGSKSNSMTFSSPFNSATCPYWEHIVDT
jgi:hypothetical protein